MLYLVAKKTLSSKDITLELSSDLQYTSVVNSEVAKTKFVDDNQEQNDEKESQISWATSFYRDVWNFIYKYKDLYLIIINNIIRSFFLHTF